MHERDFTSGDVVRLKSGGPLMTISCTFNGSYGKEAVCQWFNLDGVFHSQNILLTSLRKTKHEVD